MCCSAVKDIFSRHAFCPASALSLEIIPLHYFPSKNASASCWQHANSSPSRPSSGDLMMTFLSLAAQTALSMSGRWKQVRDLQEITIPCQLNMTFEPFLAGHLDRVVHGVTAEEILNACDEKLDIPEHKLTNPTISIAQAFKRHNLATFRNLASQQFKKAQDVLQVQQGKNTHPSLVQRPPTSPLMIQGLRTNAKDPDSHIVFFDTEALIGE